MLQTAILPSDFGFVGIVARARGLCSVGLYADEAEAHTAWAALFPSQTVTPHSDLLELAHALIQHVQTGASIPAWPLDIAGTDFQQRVWRELQAIPRGQTLTYAQLTAKLGEPPTAIRAVAGAVGANPLALVIPCHRVLGHDGRLTGYRWGITRKQQLLQSEGRMLL